MTMILSFFSPRIKDPRSAHRHSPSNKSKSSMKLLSTLVWASALPPGVYAQTTYACPSLGSIALPISPADGVTTIRLPRVPPSDGLCLLTRRNASTGGERATASRSYAGRNWERSPGVFAKTGSGVVVDCTQGSATECDVTLPALESGYEYILESHTYDISEEAKAARFLEQVSFGFGGSL